MEKNVSEFDEIFVENYNGDGDKGYIPEVDIEYPEVYIIFIAIYNSYQKEWKLKNAISLYATCMIKENMMFI